MTLDELKNSAEFCARIDKLAFLVKATFEFDPVSGHLRTIYEVDRRLSGDIEECELIDGELTAAFPEIRTAETIYVDGVRKPGITEVQVVVRLK